MRQASGKSILEACADLATVILALGALYLAAAAFLGRQPGRAGEPLQQPDLVGRSVAGLVVQPTSGSGADTLWLSGSATILYVFSTTCMFCEGQKDHIGELLTELDGVRVLTASRESPATTARYWGERDLPIIHLTDEAVLSLGAVAVPTLYVITEDAVIARAYLGSMMLWPVNRIRDELGRLLRRPVISSAAASSSTFTHLGG